MDHIYAQLEQADECWEWTGSRGPAGHGQVWHDGTNQTVYRVIWEDMVGPIPEGLELDHLCRNPPCCNPDHLEPVTHAENMRRGSQSFETRTHCLSGRHPLTEQNVITRESDGRQRCRACRNEAKRAARARLRAA